jgi:hypothetical protein
MDTGTVRIVVWTVAMAVAAVVMGMIGGLLVLPVGLILDDRLSWLLVLAVAALFGALGATWAGTLLARDAGGVRLAPVLTFSEGVALGLWLVRLSPVGSPLVRALETNLAFVSCCALVLGLAAAVAAVRHLADQRDLGRLVRVTFSLIGGVVIAVPAVVYIASLFGLVGA